jgi:uncharacterized protein (TIGR00288 family)
MRTAAMLGQVTVKRGYGNPQTLTNKWQGALIGHAITPSLQYQCAAKKNTANIALALDAQEAMFENRADVFCLVTSDSDFTYLCHKLRERGAMVCIVGELKTPDALRNESDQFVEWCSETINPVHAPAETKGAEHPAQSSQSYPATMQSHGEVSIIWHGHHLKQPDPNHELLSLHQEARGHWSITIAPEPERSSPQETTSSNRPTR